MKSNKRAKDFQISVDWYEIWSSEIRSSFTINERMRSQSTALRQEAARLMRMEMEIEAREANVIMVLNHVDERFERHG